MNSFKLLQNKLFVSPQLISSRDKPWKNTHVCVCVCLYVCVREIPEITVCRKPLHEGVKGETRFYMNRCLWRPDCRVRLVKLPSKGQRNQKWEEKEKPHLLFLFFGGGVLGKGLSQHHL